MVKRELSPVFMQAVQYAALPLLPWVRKRIAKEMTDDHASRLPANLLKAVRHQHGLAGMLVLEMLLFGLCMALAVVLDLTPQMPEWMRTGIGMAACILAFDMCNDEIWRALLKLGFVALCVVMGGYWTLTVLFLIAFENITWEDCLK